MRTSARTLIPILLLAVLAGCSGDRIENSEGSILLSVTDFNGLPSQVSVNATGSSVIIGTLTISNVPKNSRGSTSNLMDVQMETYQVLFQRVGTGTRSPTTLVRDILGFAPVDGTLVLSNLPVMTLQQLDNPPMSDLLTDNGGFDRETNSQVITLNLTLTFFGRTVGGDRVASEPVSFTVDFVP
jgi:hypothetical protein